MIRHRPWGREHPYEPSDDQRLPVRPLAGEAVEIRARTSNDVTDVHCEWHTDGAVIDIALRADAGWLSARRAAASATTVTHLTAAAAGRSSRHLRWSGMAPPMGESGCARYRLRAQTRGGEQFTRWHTVLAASWQTGGGTVKVTGRNRVVDGSVQWFVDADGTHKARFALPLGEKERVFGFGERFDRVDQRGHCIDAVVFEQYKGQAAAGRTYLPMPFAHVVGGIGWGFHVRTSRRTWFDVGANEPDLLWIEVELGGGQQEKVEISFYEGTPQQVLAAYLAETGQPQTLPAWVHRLWASSNEWNTQRRVEAVVKRHDVEGIPVGVVVIEAWSDESTFTAFRDAVYELHPDGAPHRLADFAFPAAGAWPDPKGMVDALHDREIKVILWQIPLQKMRPHPRGQARADAKAMIEGGYCVREADGRPYRNRGWWFPLALMPDFTNPEAREWWLAKRRYLVTEVGIDGFKTDGGEHAWGHDLRYANGERGDEANNLYPVRYAAAYGQLLEDAGKAPVTFSRAGFTGSTAHGCFWAGDEDSTWEAYRASLTAGLNAGASGFVYWGWDLGGFSGPLPSAELYLRSAAAACFSPIMQYHSEYNRHRKPLRDRTPWNVAEQTRDPQVLDIFRQFAYLRERLVPYLADQAAAGIAVGMPLMRPLAMVWPDDDEIWRYPLQYLLGDALLVCPVTTPGALTWDCYLPDGTWVDIWTGVRRSGRTAVTVPAPLSRIPVWCRAESWPVTESLFTDAREEATRLDAR